MKEEIEQFIKERQEFAIKHGNLDERFSQFLQWRKVRELQNIGNQIEEVNDRMLDVFDTLNGVQTAIESLHNSLRR